MLRSKIVSLAASFAVLSTASVAFAGTAPYFTPLTESAPVTSPNSVEEETAPWVTPAGVSQVSLTDMNEIEADANQSVVRAPFAGNVASMWDMSAWDFTGRYIFTPHETPWGAGLSRYDYWTDTNDLLWAGDNNGINGDWSNDYGAFDPSTFTPNCTVVVGEEWTGEGRLIETMNPFAPIEDVEIRELESIANVSHEGTRFSANGKVLYYVDEWNSGSIYKFVTKKKGDYTVGQTFVLSVDAFAGNPADLWNDSSNAGQPRTGMATWVAITDRNGNHTTTVDPFLNGPTNDPRTNTNTRGGRPAADEVNATPYGRPEDMEVGKLANDNEVVYFAATSERTVYSVEELGNNKAMVRVFASDAATPKNLGFAPTTAELNSPDNLAQDALGNIYIIEDAPNGSSTGGDIWFVRDVDGNGEAESVDHFLSLRVAGSESTGMIFNPQVPTQFAVNIQHPTSTNLDSVPDGYGDATWLFDVTDAVSRKELRALNRAGKRASKRLHQTFKSCAAAIDDQRVDPNNEPYVQINNGTIVTNAGQQFQVVVQFGNKSQETVNDSRLWCAWDDDLGTLGNSYPGPYSTVVSDSFKGDNLVAFGTDGIYGATPTDGVSMIPGQNYNASFDVKVSAASGYEGTVSCFLYADDGGPVDSAHATVKVQ